MKKENLIEAARLAAALGLPEYFYDQPTAGAGIATIRRNAYPREYNGWSVERDSPRWTSDRLSAAPVPLEILVDELNKIAAREPNVWAVVYPQKTL